MNSSSPTASAVVGRDTGVLSDDLLAGCSLLALAALGLLLHLLEVVAMVRLVSKVIGFRFFLALSVADMLLLHLFGVFPGLIILTGSTGPLTAWVHPLHTAADTVWFSMCYMNIVIALTRFACVVFPIHFHKLRKKQAICWGICLAVCIVALAQSWTMNSFPWFITVWYAPGSYGMTCDWVAYDDSGTRTLYVSLNGSVICAYLAIYTGTAAIIFVKRNVRFQFFSTILTRRNSTDPVEANNRTVPTQNMLMRKVSVAEHNESMGEVSTHISLEVRLVIPSCVNSLIFVVGQLIIINGGVGPGKWAALSVMLIFCVQSIAPPALRFAFSDVLREQVVLALRIRKEDDKHYTPQTNVLNQRQRLAARLWTVVASNAGGSKV